MITKEKGLTKSHTRAAARAPKAKAPGSERESTRRGKTKKRERIEDLKAKIAELGRFASFPILNPNPIVEIDLSGNIIFMNNAAKNVLREGNLGEHGDMFLPADIGTILTDARNGVALEYYREVSIHGRVFEERIYHSPEYHSLRIYAHDITEQSNAEEQLKHSIRELQQRQRELSALLQGSSAVLRYDNFMDAAQGIFNACKDVIGAASGYIAIVSEDGKHNEVVYLDSGGLACTVDPDTPMPIRGLRGEVFNSGRPIYHNDFSRSEWNHFLPDGHVRLENVLMAPMIIGSKVVGLFGLGNKPGGFTDHDVQIASAFSEFAAISLMRKHVEGALRESKEVLQKANEELERQVQERTEDLFDAYEKVLSERQRFFSVLEKIPGYVCLLTRDYTFSYVNEAFKERFGDPKWQPCYLFLFNRQTPCDTCITFKVCDDLKPQQREWVGPDNKTYTVFDYPFTDVCRS